MGMSSRIRLVVPLYSLMLHGRCTSVQRFESNTALRWLGLAYVRVVIVSISRLLTELEGVVAFSLTGFAFFFLNMSYMHELSRSRHEFSMVPSWSFSIS